MSTLRPARPGGALRNGEQPSPTTNVFDADRALPIQCQAVDHDRHALPGSTHGGLFQVAVHNAARPFWKRKVVLCGECRARHYLHVWVGPLAVSIERPPEQPGTLPYGAIDLPALPE